jgi:hypothetical protein
MEAPAQCIVKQSRLRHILNKAPASVIKNECETRRPP